MKLKLQWKTLINKMLRWTLSTYTDDSKSHFDINGTFCMYNSYLVVKKCLVHSSQICDKLNLDGINYAKVMVAHEIVGDVT